MVNILLFGPIAEKIGHRTLEYGYRPALKLHDLLLKVTEDYPQISQEINCIAVNQCVTKNMGHELTDGDEVALMSRFSGG